ncbi:agrin-like isoform X2 [Dendronephthya gigantea]|uniref:agrin-like isoform X2 n=1 Tax=Dendronephthya gigantea TaxID=151771 RepID=UPI0010695278|nr:agrin-like isoform X2 [Dendronephthya gigantea]
MAGRTSSTLVIFFIALATLFLKTDAKTQSNRTDECYKPCRIKSTPVCGNDGRNYTTGCHLSVARCRARKIGQRLFAINTGFCQSSKPVSQCNLNCTERRALLCASDGKTYKNLCLFKRAKCEARKRKEPTLKVISRRGPCVQKSSQCRPYSSCPKVKRPVCGTDNRTYQNICYLKGKNCRLKRAAKGGKYKKLTLKYCGACGRGKRCALAWTQRCPEVKFCDQLLRAGVRYAETKQKATKSSSLKKAGKGNQRVPRLPKKKRTKKPKKTNTKKANTKKANTKKANTKKKTNKKNSNIKMLKKFLNSKPNSKKNKKTKPTPNKKAPAKIIPKKMFQVCGSDGVTYPSLCHLQVEQCKKMNKCQRLQMKHKGACKKRPRKNLT